jgi:hypothetical protein
MTRLYIQYKDNSAVSILTQTLHSVIQGEEPVVVDLVTACASEPTRRLLGLPEDHGPLNIHLPDGIARSAIKEVEDCFASADPIDTTLDPGCLLSALDSLGSKAKQPLIIKYKNAGQGIA